MSFADTEKYRKPEIAFLPSTCRDAQIFSGSSIYNYPIINNYRLSPCQVSGIPTLWPILERLQPLHNTEDPPPLLKNSDSMSGRRLYFCRLLNRNLYKWVMASETNLGLKPSMQGVRGLEEE